MRTVATVPLQETITWFRLKIVLKSSAAPNASPITNRYPTVTRMNLLFSAQAVFVIHGLICPFLRPGEYADLNCLSISFPLCYNFAINETEMF